ncbi:glycoside hydrolase family 25 protein [Amycolatopsis thermoflava]|uniref:glycoside hydrolase family 25 protein n=1 Tax=Amycolatopsis thermoflava TaxID=84480 RepID=UPI00041720BE|nr:glycoside hydrolase family 25 protein [Amycolatopsis thermoflava]
MSLGVDLHCYYQRAINWGALAAANLGGSRVEYGWVKVSDGGSAYTKKVDGVTYYPSTMVNGLKGIGRKVGAYHYAQFSPSPEAQADVLVREARRLDAMDLVPMLDLEDPFEANAAAKDFAIRFCKRVAAQGVKPGVYMSASFAKTLRPDQWGIPGLVIWIARYGAKPEAAGSAQYTGRYDIHQYSSTQDIGGLADVDVNWAYTNNHLMAGNQEDDMFDDTDRQILRTICNQLTGNPAGDPWNVPGWPSLVTPGAKLSVTDYVRWLDLHAVKTGEKVNAIADLVAKQNGVTAEEIAAALRTGLVADLLPVLQQVLADALDDDNGEQAAAISDAVLTKLGEKLAGGNA